MDISVVIPVYGCKEALPELYRRLTDTLSKLVNEYEIILVNDACPQDSWSEIERICSYDTHVLGVDLSRNFGQHAAITAGISESSGDYVVVMDCDLQDRPEEISKLYDRIKKEYDIVFSTREGRRDNIIVQLFSKCFHNIFNYFADVNYDFEVGNYCIATRQVVDEFLKMKEQKRDYIMFLKWLGFKSDTIELESDKRFSGKSSYTFSKKVKVAVNMITAQSDKPLGIAIKLGFIIALGAFIYILYLLYNLFVLGNVPTGWTSTVASIYLMGGLMMSTFGISAIYVGNIFNETKHRPIYVIRTVLNGKKD
ncbi:MAG: glycosyltransferase family 2 protein [Lachnospiraceae bacterium]|nr:glycosyltransferase family 2 protein [Lachnospiraceae bacterium]